MKALKLESKEVIVANDVYDAIRRQDDGVEAYVVCDEDGVCFFIYHEDDWKKVASVFRGFGLHPMGDAAVRVAERIEHDVE